jgi:4-hydroxy-tetrahydrodipicolinate reductase
MKRRVIVAGVTGWVGKPLAEAIRQSEDLELVGAVSRSTAGQSLEDALRTSADVFVDYTSAAAVRGNVLAAVRAGLHVVIGSSGLAQEDFDAIDAEARAAGVGVLAVGNFAVAAALLQRFAVEAAKHFPAWEILDFAYAGKMDAPSGTARELAWRMAEVRRPELAVPIDQTVGVQEARGADILGSRVHSIRVPGYTIGIEVRFGREDERLTLHYDGGTGATPYIAGTLLAIRRVHEFTGVERGMDRVL